MPVSRIAFLYQTLAVGGVETILRARTEELLRRGIAVKVIFQSDAGGRRIFNGLEQSVEVLPDDADVTDALSRFAPEWVSVLDTPKLVHIAHSALPDVPISYEVHSPHASGLAPLADARLLRDIRCVLAPTDAKKQLVFSLLREYVPVAVVPNALKFRTSNVGTAAAASGRPVVLWVGRLDPIKNWDGFLEVVRIAASKCDADFVMIGGASDEEAEKRRLRDAIAAHEFAERITWMPFVDYERMPDQYARAAARGCYVSTARAETLPQTLLEAMSSRCPSVVPRAPGFEVVSDGVNGWTYPAGDWSAAASVIRNVLKRGTDVDAVVEAASSSAEIYAPERSVEVFLEMVERFRESSDCGSVEASSASAIDVGAEDRAVFVLLPGEAQAARDRHLEIGRRLAAHSTVYLVEKDGIGTKDDAVRRVPNVPAGATRGALIVSAGSAPLLRCVNEDLIRIYDASDEADAESDGGRWLLAHADVVIAPSRVAEGLRRRRPDVVSLDTGGARDVAPLLSAIERLRHSDGLPAHLALIRASRFRDSILVEALAEHQHVIGVRDQSVAFLQKSWQAALEIIESRDDAISSLQYSLDFRTADADNLRKALTNTAGELANAREVLGARDEAISFLRSEVEVRLDENNRLRTDIGQITELIPVIGAAISDPRFTIDDLRLVYRHARAALQGHGAGRLVELRGRDVRSTLALAYALRVSGSPQKLESIGAARVSNRAEQSDTISRCGLARFVSLDSEVKLSDAARVSLVHISDDATYREALRLLRLLDRNLAPGAVIIVGTLAASGPLVLADELLDGGGFTLEAQSETLRVIRQLPERTATIDDLIATPTRDLSSEEVARLVRGVLD